MTKKDNRTPEQKEFDTKLERYIKLREKNESLNKQAVLKKQQEIKAHKEDKEKKHLEVVSSVKTSADDIVKAIKTETDKLDKEIDLKPVIKAINNIEIPKDKDYSTILEEIKSYLPENVDLSNIEKLLKKISAKNILENVLSTDGDRIKVEVDRAGGGGGPNQIQIENSDNEIINPATEEKQDAIIAAIGSSVTPTSTDLEGLGDIAVGLTEVEIAITGTPTSIRIQADKDNTGVVFIGKTGVLANKTNDFWRGESGDEITISYDDTTNALYAISDTAGQAINVGALL